jgi:hypothetical protein
MKKLIFPTVCLCGIFLTTVDVFAGRWTEVPGATTESSNLAGVAVVSANDAWAVGSVGRTNSSALIEHWDGNAWSVSLEDAASSQFRAVAARSATDVWAVGQNEEGLTMAEHWDGQQWSVTPSPSIGTYDFLLGVCAISENDAWAVGSSQSPVTKYILMHWDGSVWSLVAGPPANGSSLNSLKAFSSDDVWAVGGEHAAMFTIHWNGTVWSEIPAPNVHGGLLGVDGSASDDLWAVGITYKGLNSHPLALHWDGAVWAVVRTPSMNDNTQLYAVAAISRTRIIAVGQSAGVPLTAQWNGTRWDIIATPPVHDYSYLFGISARNGSIWTVGREGVEGHELIYTWTPRTD